MRFSVVIPCHNAARWIDIALRSVANQTLAAHEIIVVDDSSTDDSLVKIMRSGVAVRQLSVSSHNAAAARNAGIEIATGEWIAFLDADDVWYPEHLSRAEALLKEGSDVAFMSNHDWIDLDGSIIPIPDGYQCKLPAPQTRLNSEDYYVVKKDGFHFGHSTVIYRRDRLVELGMFDVAQKRRHDLDLWLRMIASGTWTYDTVKGAGYREATPGSISKNIWECDYYEIRALVKNLEIIPTRLHRACVAREARRAMAAALVDGPPGAYERIKKIACPHLDQPFKFFFSTFGAFCPGLLRNLIKMKRRVFIGLAPQS